MKKVGELVFVSLMLGGFLSIVGIAVIELAQAQNTKSRHNVDANKKWELLHDATGQVLASCDEKLACLVQDDLTRMITCHERLGKALSLALLHDGYLSAGMKILPAVVLTEEQWDSLNLTYQECAGRSR